MIENPVRSPMVPPIADNMSTNLAALSLVILLIVGVSKNILTYLRSFFHSVLEKLCTVRRFEIHYKTSVYLLYDMSL